MLGITHCTPLEVTWDDGESLWVTLWVTDFGKNVSVMATCTDKGTYAGVDLPKDDPIFSAVFISMVEVAIGAVSDDASQRWKTQKFTVELRRT